jgi:hypothetical protein
MLYCTSTVTFGAASFLTGMLKRRIKTTIKKHRTIKYQY